MILQSLRKIYSNKLYILITGIISVLIFYLYLFLMLRNSSWAFFWESNSFIYNLLQLLTSFINAVLSGIAFTFFIYIFRTRQESDKLSSVQSLAAIFFSAAATGCYVCGAVLLPTLGIAASLTALPFGGLEIKFMTIGLLIYSIYEYSKAVLGICFIEKRKFLEIKDGHLYINREVNVFRKYKSILIVLLFTLIIFTLPSISKLFRMDFANVDANGNSYTCNQAE